MLCLLADEGGGIHIEALGELAERGHARLYFVPHSPQTNKNGPRDADLAIRPRGLDHGGIP